MSDLDNQEPLSNVSDSSFVILGQGSLTSNLNKELDSPVENLKADSLINSKSTFSVFESTNSSINDRLQSKWVIDGSCLCEGDIQKKLDAVVKENCELKETLIQNNLAIKSQLDTFFLWQQEVLKTHETHKQKFLETKDLILKLLAENTNLKKQLDESLTRVSSENGKDLNAEVNKKPEELDDLREKVREYERICNDLTGENANLGMENQRLKEELKAERKEILKLNKELEDSGRENSFLKQRSDEFKKNSLESLPHRSLPNAEARAQISNLLKQLEEEKRKVAKLREELKKGLSSSAEATLSTVEELNKYIDKLDDMNTSFVMQNERFSSLQSWVALAEENIKENKTGQPEDCNLVGEINTLKSHLNQEKHTFREKQEYLQELRGQFNRLLADYQDLQLQFKLIKSNEQSIEKYKEELSSLSSELQAKDRELVSTKEEYKTLQSAFEVLQAECQDVTALKEQVELFKTDFNEEKEAKEKLISEREELQGKLKFLEGRILHLEQESLNQNKSGSADKRCICPTCTNTFPDSKAFDEHFNDSWGCYF